MSTVAAIQNAQVQEFWLRNACAKHGVPYDQISASMLAMLEAAKNAQEETGRKPEPEPEPPPEPKPTPEPVQVEPIKVDPIQIQPIEVAHPGRPPTPEPSPAGPPNDRRPWWQRWLPWILGSLLAILGIASLLTAIFWNSQGTNIELAPAQDSSVLQWLEDENLHLDPELRS